MSDRGAGLRLLAADEDRAALEELASVLRGLGHAVTSTAVTVAEALAVVAREEPDAAIVMVHRDREHALALIEEAAASAPGPVLALLPEPDPAFVAEAADAGVDALVAGLAPAAVQSALELAVRRHAERRALADRVDQLQTALERKTLIERAKGVLMERHGLDERAAFERLRADARPARRSVLAVAREVVDTHDGGGRMSEDGH